MPTLDLHYLASELPPYLQEILAKTGQDVASNLLAKGAETLVRGAGRGARSIAASLWGRVRSSSQSNAALASFADDWEHASDAQAREAAVRRLLETDPQFAASAAALIQRRDYVSALRDYAAELPIAGVEAAVSLSDVYVSLPLFAGGSKGVRVERVDPLHLALQGDHLVIGEAGSGKSSLLRYVAFEVACRMLDDDAAVAFDQLRQPVLVHARALLNSVDFASALRTGAMESLATFLRNPLPTDFFQPGAAEGHSRWLVLLDGVDEVDEPDRTRLLRVVGSHAQRGESFRFVVAGRPEVVGGNDALEGFCRWSIHPLDDGERSALIDRYLIDAKLREAFARRVGTAAFNYIAQRPLFLAISATLFADTGELFKRKADLLEHFAQFLCAKVVGHDPERQAALRLVFRSIATDIDCSAALVSHDRALIEGLVGTRSVLALERELDRLLLRTGLVRKVGKRHRFSHELIRSHFAAAELAEHHTPSPDTLATLDPFRVGWATISLLGQLWGSRGLDVEPVVRSLLQFGDEGLRCAVEIIAAVPSVSDVPVLRITKLLLRQSRETGPTIVAHEMLVVLAEARETVRISLIDELHSEEYLDHVFIAECLLDAGVEDEATEHLLWLAEDSHGYSPDRVHAAELLLKHGRQDEAMDALRDIAGGGDEHWAVVEAAVLLFRHERTEENRAQLAELLAMEPTGPGQSVFMSTFTELVSMGEVELALPRLRAAARVTADEDGWSARREAIEAAIAIGEHHDGKEGMALLEGLLQTGTTLRDSAEVISAIAELGFEAEARSAMRDSLTQHPLAIEWYSLELLGNLGLIDLAQAALEMALEHHLTSRGATVHDIASLLDHIPDTVDPKPLAHILRKHLPRRREPRLVSCLAALGAVDEARSALARFLDDSDIRQQIEAAGELCQLGGQQRGLRRLRLAARRKDLSTEVRMLAAETLERVGLLRHAAFAFARIAHDEALSVESRAKAAIAFDKLLHRRNDLVWHDLMRILRDMAKPVADRVEAGDALLTIDGDDGYDDLVLPEIEAILEEDGVSDRDALVVGKVLGQRGWRLDDMPRVRSALTSAQVGLGERINAMGSINCHDRNPEVEPLLLAIASDTTVPAKYAIKAAESAGRSSQANEALRSLAADGGLPSAWRLAAINARRPKVPSNELLRLARDEAIAIDKRIEALDQLPKAMASRRDAALSKLAAATDLTVWEWLSVANAAQRFEKPVLRAKALRAARADGPLSIGERIALAKAHREDGDEATVRELAVEMLALSAAIWANCDDSLSVLEALELGAEFEPEASIRLARDLLLSDQTSWWDAPHLLTTLIGLTSEAEALAIAEPMLRELGRSLREANADDFGWPRIAADFVEPGWFDDYRALLAFGANETLSLMERVHAYGLVLRHSPVQSSSRQAAIAALDELECDKELSERDRVSAAERLRNLGLHSESEAWLKECLQGNAREEDHPLAKARLLEDLGRHDEAKAMLRAADPQGLFQGFLFARDERLLRSALGDDTVDSKMREMAFANDDPCDQLWRARELVEKTGDRELLGFLRDSAFDPSANSDERLEAIDALEQLGLRSLSRAALALLDIDKLDPVRAAGQLIRAGRKVDAVTLLAKLGSAPSEDDTYRLALMSDLGLVGEIARTTECRRGLLSNLVRIG